MSALQIARAAGLFIRPITGDTVRLRGFVLDVGCNAPDSAILDAVLAHKRSREVTAHV